MITPSPTTKIDPRVCRGVLNAIQAPTATKPGHIVVSIPNTSYELHLIPTGPIKSAVGKRALGIIRAQARRIDVVQTGGRYVEPVYGRPRRVQGSVLAIDPQNQSIVVDAAVPIHCKTNGIQKPEDFVVGQFVSFDVLEGATFTPAQG